MTLARALERSIKKKGSFNCPKHSNQNNKARPAHLVLGAMGEDLASEFLVNKKYQILHRNVRFRYGELDIIARDGDEIVFVEVRTRTVGKLSPPETTVGPQKIKKLIRSARLWIEGVRYMGFWRIDLIAVTITDAGNKIEHIKTITEAVG